MLHWTVLQMMYICNLRLWWCNFYTYYSITGLKISIVYLTHDANLHAEWKFYYSSIKNTNQEHQFSIQATQGVTLSLFYLNIGHFFAPDHGRLGLKETLDWRPVGNSCVTVARVWLQFRFLVIFYHAGSISWKESPRGTTTLLEISK